MIDPAAALPSFQAALDSGELLALSRPGLLDKDIWLHVDPQTHPPRFIYFRTELRNLVAMVVFAKAPDVEGAPCMQVGYAVPESHRRRGHAKGTLKAAIAELENGFAGHPPFFIEAIVDQSNAASQGVAAAAISEEHVSVVDVYSGVPAFRYLRKLVPPRHRAEPWSVR